MSPEGRAELCFQIYAARGCTLPELATLRRYSSTYDWVTRRRKLQDEDRRRNDASALKMLREQEPRSAQLGVVLHTVVMAALRRLAGDMSRVKSLSAGEIARLAEVGTRVINEALGAAVTFEKVATRISDTLVPSVLALFLRVQAIHDPKVQTREFAFGLDRIMDDFISSDTSLPGFERGARDQLAEKQWQELRTYHRYLDALVGYRGRNAEPPSGSRTPLFVVGDGHSLSPARFPLRLGGRPYVAAPRLVFGVKAWHLARAHRGDANLYASAFATALAALPSGSMAAMSVGEIDPRAEEGFLPVLRRAGIDTAEERRARVAPAVADALAFAAQAARQANVTLVAITVPAPRPDVSDRASEDARDVAGIVRLVNDSLREAASDLGVGVIDVYAHTLGADGFAKQDLHLDSVHLLPSVLGKASR